MSFRIGFFGAGLIARYHAASLRAAEVERTHGLQLAAVVDPDGPRAEAFAAQFGAAVTTEEALLDGVDAVYVATWTSEHERLVEAAAARGLPIFCEKPLGVDLASARRMTETVQRAGVTNQVGLVLRSTTGFNLYRRLVRRPEAGRIMTVLFRDDQMIPVGNMYGSTWRGDRARAGAGTLIEHSIHDLDLLEWICGPVATITAHQGNFHGFEGIEDTVAVSFALLHGGTGVLSSTWHDIEGRGSCRRFEIFTERGRFEADGNAAEAVRWQYHGAEHEASEGSGPHRRALGDDAPGNADRAFVEAAVERRPATPDFTVALRAHELVDAVYRSARNGGVPVSVTPSGA